jgi:hypothetical protein
MNKRQATAIAATVVVAAAAGGGLVVASLGRHGNATASTFASAPGLAGRAAGLGPPGGMPGGGRGPGGGLDAAATYLGVSASTLSSDLRSGKTLADFARSTGGKTVDGLIAAMVAAQTQRLDAAVTDRDLTAAQEATLLAGLKAQVTAMVNGTGGFGAGPPPGLGANGAGGGSGTIG